MDERALTLFPKGRVDAPPSKSFAHRALFCAALAEGTSRIENIGESEDVRATARCLERLSADIQWDGPNATVRGGLKKGAGPFDCGESGTTLRLLAPLSKAVSSEDAKFYGRPSLMRRPLGALLDALKGVAAEKEGESLLLKGALLPGSYEIEGNVSSQFVSGLLLALATIGNSRLTLSSPLESSAYVAMTLDAMGRFGATAQREGWESFSFGPPACWKPAQARVEGDYSGAAFFLVASALGADVAVGGLDEGSLQGDRAILAILEKSGARVSRENGALRARAKSLSAQVVDAREAPDLVPPVAALLCFAEGESRIVNASRLRYKESDRLESVCAALSRLGADIRVEGDSLAIRGKRALAGGAAVDPAGDHRIAMMAAVAALRCTGGVRVKNSGCVAKSYPSFWADFEKSRGKALQ